MVTELAERATHSARNSGERVQLRRRSDQGRGAWPRITQHKGGRGRES